MKATTKRKKSLEQESMLTGRDVAKQSEMAGIKSENDGSEEWKAEMWQRNGHMDGSTGPGNDDDADGGYNDDDDDVGGDDDEVGGVGVGDDDVGIFSVVVEEKLTKK